jgi:hypothetical protein
MIRLKWLAVGVFTLFLAGLSSPAPTAAADTSA